MAASPVTFRPVEERELTNLVRLEREHGHGMILTPALDAHRACLGVGGTQYLWVIFEGEIAGFVILVHDESATMVELRRIVVARAGCGIGTSAINALCERAHRDGAEAMWLDVYEDNAIARRVYERCGFRPSTRAAEDGTGRGMIVYRRDFQQSATDNPAP